MAPRSSSSPLSNSITDFGTFSSSEPHSQLTEESSSALDIEPLSTESLAAIRRLSRYKAAVEGVPEWREGKGRAAVLVALFGSRDGANLNVLLSTRSKTLRSFPGQVALPGGKQDPGDISLEATARREAYEEVGLPISPFRIRYLCELAPFLSRNLLLVTPIVCFVLDYSLKPRLNPSEVTRVFSFPLSGFLSSTRPFSHDPHDDHSTSSSPTEEGDEKTPYHSSTDYPWYGDKPHRFHAFRGRPSAVEGQDTPMITGLTASILIKVAKIAYGRPTEFENHAPEQLSMGELVRFAMIKDRKQWEGLHGPIPEEVASEEEKAKKAKL